MSEGEPKNPNVVDMRQWKKAKNDTEPEEVAIDPEALASVQRYVGELISRRDKIKDQLNKSSVPDSKLESRLKSLEERISIGRRLLTRPGVSRVELVDFLHTDSEDQL